MFLLNYSHLFWGPLLSGDSFVYWWVKHIVSWCELWKQT